MAYIRSTIEHRGHTIKIVMDEDPENPREWDNFGTMVCFHPRYDLGDADHGFASPRDIATFVERECIIALPLFLYDHSGLSMATAISPYWWHAAWDAGQVGYIYATVEDAEAEGFDRGEAEDYMRGEVETYDQYLRGAVWRYEIESADLAESCGGYFGDAGATQALADAQAYIDTHVATASHQATLPVA